MSKTVNATMNAMTAQQPTATFGGDWNLSGLLARVSAAVFGTMVAWQVRANERAHLAAMEDHRLADAGLSRDDARREAAKPFWQA